MGCRCAPTATTGFPGAINAPAPITPPGPETPVRPKSPGPAISPRGSWSPTAPPSPSRTVRLPPGRACGANELPCSAPACWWPPSNANAKPPAAPCRAPAPDPPRFPNTACGGRGARVQKPPAQPTHNGGHCALHGDRDIVSAMLAACVELADPDDPRTARVDYRLAHALRAWLGSPHTGGGGGHRGQGRH